MTRINICIPTYNRNDGLKDLLSSLQKMTPLDDESISVNILVIDNNPDRRARSVVDGFQSEVYPIPVAYHHEPRPGVSHVRNTALALSANADFIAFVDDDQTVAVQWLTEHWRRRCETQAGVVWGACPAVYPERTSQWMLDGDFHSRIILEDNLRDAPVGIGNTFIEHAIIKHLDLSFDPSLSEIGGEDILLFSEMKAAGVIMANARNAIAYEHVPAGRVTLKWIRRRWRRAGWSDTLVKHRASSGLKPRILAFVAGMIRIGAGGLLTGVWFILGGLKMTPRVAKGLYTLQRGLGMVDFARGHQILEYGRPVEA